MLRQLVARLCVVTFCLALSTISACNGTTPSGTTPPTRHAPPEASAESKLCASTKGNDPALGLYDIASGDVVVLKFAPFHDYRDIIHKAKRAGATAVHPFTVTEVHVLAPGGVITRSGFGLEAERLRDLSRWLRGRLPNGDDFELVLAGEDARDIGVKLGDRVKIAAGSSDLRDATVVGLVEVPVSPAASNRAHVWLTRGAGARLDSARGPVDGVAVDLDEETDRRAWAKKFGAELGRDYEVTAASELQTGLRAWTDDVRGFCAGARPPTREPVSAMRFPTCASLPQFATLADLTRELIGDQVVVRSRPIPHDDWHKQPWLAGIEKVEPMVVYRGYLYNSQRTHEIEFQGRSARAREALSAIVTAGDLRGLTPQGGAALSAVSARYLGVTVGDRIQAAVRLPFAPHAKPGALHELDLHIAALVHIPAESTAGLSDAVWVDRAYAETIIEGVSGSNAAALWSNDRKPFALPSPLPEPFFAGNALAQALAPAEATRLVLETYCAKTP